MDLGLRARLATAMLELAFNPHQRRGPDGRWIKMQTNELKRPRRPKKAKAPKSDPVKAKASSPVARATSDVPMSRLAPAPTESTEEMRERLARWQRSATATFGEQRSRWPADERAGIALLEAAIDGRLSRDSEQPQVLIADDAARYRAERDTYNAEVMAYAAVAQARAQERWGKPDETLQAHINSVIDAINDDEGGDDPFGLVNENVDLLREELDREHDGRGVLPFEPTGDEARVLPLLPPGPRTSGGDRPPVTDSYEDRRAALDRSIRSGIVDQDLIGDGAMGDTRRVILADGSEAIYKRAQGSWYGWGVEEQTDAEELGALVAAAAGVRAPAIQRVSDTALYMEMMPGLNAARRGMGRAPQSITDTPAGMRMGLLDVLLNNRDRHSGNWMIDLDNNISAIDHGLAFRNAELDVSSPFAGQFVDTWGDYKDTNPLTDRDVEQIRADLKKARPRFEELGRADWFDQVTQRLDQLAARASGYRPLLEDAPAMFASRAAAALATLRG
jgi:phosphoinositide 3-/4-kinase-like protein